FGASDSSFSLGCTWGVPLVVTKFGFSLTSTVAFVAGIAVNRVQPLEPVVASSQLVAPDSPGLYVTRTTTPDTPEGGVAPFCTSTSSPDPVGGVMTLEALTAGRLT